MINTSAPTGNDSSLDRCPKVSKTRTAEIKWLLLLLCLPVFVVLAYKIRQLQRRNTVQQHRPPALALYEVHVGAHHADRSTTAKLRAQSSSFAGSSAIDKDNLIPGAISDQAFTPLNDIGGIQHDGNLPAVAAVAPPTSNSGTNVLNNTGQANCGGGGFRGAMAAITSHGVTVVQDAPV